MYLAGGSLHGETQPLDGGAVLRAVRTAAGERPLEGEIPAGLRWRGVASGTSCTASTIWRNKACSIRVRASLSKVPLPPEQVALCVAHEQDAHSHNTGETGTPHGPSSSRWMWVGE